MLKCHVTICMLVLSSGCRLLTFFKNNLFKSFFQEHYQCQTVWIQVRTDFWSGSKLFAKVISRRQDSLLARKVLIDRNTPSLIFVDILKSDLIIFLHAGKLYRFFMSADLFSSKLPFSKTSPRITSSMSYSLVPGKAGHFVRPDLGPYCFV